MLKQIPSIIGGYKGSVLSKEAYIVYSDAEKLDLHLLTKLWIDTKSALMDPIWSGSDFCYLSWYNAFMGIEIFQVRKLFQYMPGSLVAVIIGSVLAYFFTQSGNDAGSSLALVTEQKVGLPQAVKDWDFKKFNKIS